MRYLSRAVVGGLVLTLGCGGGEAAEQEYPDAVAADPAHYSVEFENDAVRLLRIRYEPGETSVMHRHPETCSIALTDGSWRMTAPGGEVTEEDPMVAEDVECGTPPTVHSPGNSGTTINELILVEFKEGASPGNWTSSEPDAVTVDPDHYSVVFENDAVRVLRISYGAHEQSVLHHHPANCFVSLDDGSWHMGNAEGEVTEVPVTMGKVECADADVHLPTNAMDDTGDVVLIEFKGRETVAS